ncbi:MAG: NAD(P)H-dependent oxidoreductase [Thermoguttaceae bacterium]
MKYVIILGHQKKGSFNHAIAETVCETLKELGHEPIFHDLYAENFDPVLQDPEITMDFELVPEQIKTFCNEVKESQGMIFIHPNWWSSPPAILQGWIERVFRQNFGYHFTEAGPVPHLTDKIVQVFSTSNTPHDVEVNVYKDPIENYWKVIVFGLCGCKSFERENFGPIILSDVEQRHKWLSEVKEIIKRRFA